jgi:uncharacterized repeat protein (TIGR03943 family)
VTRSVQIVLLAAMLGLLLRLLVRGEYVYYVKPGLLPALVGSAIVLALMIAFTAKDAWVAADADHHDHHHGHDHGDDGHAEPRAALLLALPLIAILTIAPAPLGAFSAARSTTSATAAVRAYPPLPAGDPITLGVPEFVGRARADEDALVGRTVRLVGFVTPNPKGPWWLTRFVVSCCAADATTYRVLARGGPPLAADTWVTLTGHWVRADGAPDGIPTLQVEGHEPAQPPSNPYAG